MGVSSGRARPSWERRYPVSDIRAGQESKAHCHGGQVGPSARSVGAVVPAAAEQERPPVPLQDVLDRIAERSEVEVPFLRLRC